MECTPEEIAEKKRIALERLKAKREALSVAMAKTKEQPMASNTSHKIITNPYNNARNLSHPYDTSKSSLNTNSMKNNAIKLISCSCYMITESRFVVSASGFFNKLIDVFKTIPSRAYGIKCTCLIQSSKNSLSDFRCQHKILVISLE